MENIKDSATMKEVSQLNELWRARMIRMCWIFVAIVIFTEVITGAFMFFVGGIITSTSSVYWMKFLVIPTVINVLLVFIANKWNKSLAPQDRKEYAILYCLLGMCAVIAIVHSYFEWTLLLLAIPMVASVMFVDLKKTQRIALYSIPTLLFCVLLSALYERDVILKTRFVDAVVCIAYFMAIYVICRSLVSFLQQKEDIISGYDAHEHEMSHALTLDSMTGLYNHAEFNRVLEFCKNKCIREHRYMTMVMADIDHFKRVNDTYGHDNGDKVLLAVSGILSHFCSNRGDVFRYGGEEFAIILMNTGLHETLDIMNEIRDCISKERFDFMPEGEFVTISMGLFKYAGEDLPTPAIFKFADEALYYAKNHGRNRCVAYSPDLEEKR